MYYADLVDIYGKLESTSKRLDKIYFISKLLKETPKEDLEIITLLLQGRLFPKWDETEIGVSSKYVLRAIKLATGVDEKKIHEEWKITGDLGLVANNLIAKKKQVTLLSKQLTVEKVFGNLKKLAKISGEGSVNQKINLIAELMTSAKPKEAKYITRTVLEDLRVGVGESSIRDAIVWAYFPKVVGVFFKCSNCNSWMPNVPKCIECQKEIDTKSEYIGKALTIENIPELECDLSKYEVIKGKPEIAREAYNYLLNIVQQALDLSNDFGKVAEIAKDKGIKGLKQITINPNHPIKVMLYKKALDINDAFEQVGKPAASFLEPQHETSSTSATRGRGTP